MISESQFSELLPGFPSLAELVPPLKRALLLAASVLELPAGEIVFDVGEPSVGFPLLTRGSIRVCKLLTDSREVVIYRLRPGESCLLSTSCLLGNSPYPARAMSEKDVHGVLVPKELFASVIQQHQPFGQFVFQSLAGRVAQLIEFIELVGFSQLDQRLAHVLQDKPSSLQATHQQLADEVGSVREVVSRVLKGFESRGILTLGRGKITILDRSTLKKVARPLSDPGH